jgi:hypothetical protein
MTDKQYLRGTVYIFGFLHNEPEMIESLAALSSIPRRPVQSEIVTAGREIGVIRIRLPDHTHAEQGGIKCCRDGDICDIKSQVTQTTSRNWWRRCHSSSP